MLTISDILFVIAVTVKTYGNYGYLSMIDWPLLPVCHICWKLRLTSIIVNDDDDNVVSYFLYWCTN